MTESTARVERVNLQSVSSPAFTWEAPEKPVAVRIPFTLIDRMEREVVENFRSLTSRGSEIGGVLLGTIAPGSPTTVFVDDYETIPCDYSRGPLYRLSDADMGRFERVIEKHLAGNAAKVAGFFRSHTRKGLSLDSEDLSFFAARFRDPAHVALLVRPYATKASTAGFFIWENGSVQGEASYLEFPFRSSQLAPSRQNIPAPEPPPALPAVSPAAATPPAPAPPKPVVRAQIVPIASRREITLPTPPEPVETKPVSAPAAPAAPPASPVAASPAPAKEPVPVKEVEKPQAKAPAPAKPKEKEKAPEQAAARVAAPAPAAAEPAPAETPAPAMFAEPAEHPGASRGKSMLIGIVAVVTVLVGLALFVYPGILRHSSRTASTAGVDLASLSLRVERTGTDILLTWNRDSSAIQHANHATLSISDGDRHENYDMDLSQLRNGSIVYSPLTADVSFRMEVTGANNAKTASESVRVLRTRPSPMPDGSQPPVDTSKAGVKPGSPANPSSPAPADEASAEDPGTPAAKPVVPAKRFNTESLAQRLRPATPAEAPMPEAPALNTNLPVSTSVPNIGGTGVAAAPFVPAAAPPAAPATAPERRASSSSPAGGQISQAQVVYSKQPEYPKLARQLGVKGSVELIATIGADGHVKSVKIEKGHPLLVKAASDAVMQWVYRPTLLNGVPVQNDTHITLNFMGDK